MPAIKFRPFVLPFLTLLCCLLASCRPPPLMSYPWFWDYTRAKPLDAHLVGTYKILKLRLPDDLARQVREKDASIILRADHTALFTGFPDFDPLGDNVVCKLSGSADWLPGDLSGGGFGWSVEFQNYRPATKLAACGHTNTMWTILILGQHPPYRLYTIVGDPDSDTGIEFKRADD